MKKHGRFNKCSITQSLPDYRYLSTDVSAGHPLVRIDPRDYRAQTEQFESQIAIARANAEAVRAQIVEQEARVTQARGQLAAAQAAAGFAASEARRYAPLVEIGAENA